MDLRNLTTCSKSGVDSINNLRDTVAVQYEKERVESAWTHTYKMTATENEWLQECFPRQYVYPKGAFRDSEHPVLAALNDFANDDAATQVKRCVSHGFRTMTIGDSVARKIDASHNCLLLDSSREDYRIASSSKDTLQPHVVLGLETRHCVKGAQNCDFKADHAFAVHSAYDISMRDVAKIFTRHSLRTMTVYMYFTTTLYKGGHTDPYAFFHVVHDGDRSKFVMNDESIMYSHSTKRWKAWHETTAIQCHDFNLIFEVVRTYGPLRVIKIVRTRRNELGCVSRCVPLSRIFPDSVLVPDMYSAIKMNFYVEQKDIKHFVVPQYIVSSVMSYIQRAADEGYKFPEVATYWGGIIRRITIGESTVQKAFVASPQEQYRILISLFLLGALQRTDRTKTISEAFNYIKGHLKMSGLCGFVQTKWQKLCNRFADNARHWQAGKDYKLVSDGLGVDSYGFWFSEFQIINILDYETDVVHRFDRCFNRVTSGVPPSVQNIECVSKATLNHTLSDPIPDHSPSVSVITSGCPSIDSQPPPERSIPTSVAPKKRYNFPALIAKAKTLVRNSGNRANVSINNGDPRFPNGIPVLDLRPSSNVKPVAVTPKPQDRNANASQEDDDDFTGLPELFTISENKSAREGTYSQHSAGRDIQASSSDISVMNGDLSFEDSVALVYHKGVEYILGNTNPKVSPGQQDFPHPLPAGFLTGHCAIQAWFEALASKGLLSKSTSPMFILGFAANCLYDHLPNCPELNSAIVDDYILRGVYSGSNVSSICLELLAQATKVNVYIQSSVNNTVYRYGRHDERDNIILHHSGDHFSFRNNGGLITKYVDILERLSPHTHPTVLDLSAAPGFVSKHLLDRGFKVFVAVYKGGLPAKKSLKVDFEYSDVSQLFSYLKSENRKFDIVINDIGRPVNSEEVINLANSLVPSVMNDGGYLFTKTFANPHELWKMTCWSDVHLSYDSQINTERIFRCRYQQGRDVDDFFKYYDTPGWNRKITTHVIPCQDNVAFANSFFIGKLGDVDLSRCRPKNIKNGLPSDVFEVDCLSGFASASKTTFAISEFKKAVFIAPSSNLRDEHVKRGVKSYTPHLFFGSDGRFHNHNKYTHIVVDEAFQMNVAFFSLLAATYPNHRIVCLGDVHQTPPTDFAGTGRIRTLYDFGLRNNILDVYKLPQDITDAVNKTLDFRIRTHSSVVKSIYHFGGNVKEFIKSKIPVITFNQSTCSRFLDYGLNAHTITTFTGSRAAVVVFYIDSASIQSELLAKSKFVYTALSRATDAIVLMGDIDGLVKRYNIAPTPISRLEDVTGIHISHMIDLPEEKPLIPTVAPGLHKDVASIGVATNILTDIIRPLNDPSGDFISISKTNIPEVESGKLVINPDMMRDYRKNNVVYRLNKIKFAKHQLSNNVMEGIQTLTKRYSRKYLVSDKREMEYTLKELLTGLSMAIYGNDHSIAKLKRDMRMSPEYLQKRQREYLDKLNLKLKDKTVMSEIDQVCRLSDEQLKFFNKRQSKFDPKVAFDTSDKVGQGVAATSKRINVLFCGWARAVLDRVRELLEKNNRNIVLATHDSDVNMNARYIELISKFEKLYDFTCNDFSEWDASFRQAFVKLTSWLLIAAGCPRALVEEYEKFRESWVMQYRTMWGNASLHGEEKQFSGNPFTICENTIGNMALCFTLFEYKGFQFAYFKGDDSAVNCESSKMHSKASRIIQYTGHKLKLHNSPVGEFAGWFMTDKGLFPDVVRYCAKFLDKLYVDQDHFNEVVMSLQERCSAVVNSEQLFTGAAVCAHYYNELYDERIKISSQDIQSLFHFMKSSRSIKFTDLVKTEMMSYKVDAL